MSQLRVLLLFFMVLVSALATHINAESTDQLVVHHACEGETFCDVKPDNYPQEEIDRMLIQRLPYLRRMKREVIEPAPARPEGNCGVTKSELTSPFTLKNKNAVPKLIVQSQWFNQKIPRVFCKNEESECFSSYIIPVPNRRTQCATKKMVSTVTVYDFANKQFEEVSTEIDIDCACVIKNE